MGRHRKIRYCLECGAKVPEGRTDKIYCSNACRSRHFYESKQMGKEYRYSIIEALDKNHAILNELIRKKVESVELNELLYRGFCPQFMTCCRRKTKYIECGCFDILYNQNTDRIFSITKIVV